MQPECYIPQNADDEIREFLLGLQDKSLRMQMIEIKLCLEQVTSDYQSLSDAQTELYRSGAYAEAFAFDRPIFALRKRLAALRAAHKQNKLNKPRNPQHDPRHP